MRNPTYKGYPLGKQSDIVRMAEHEGDMPGRVWARVYTAAYLG